MVIKSVFTRKNALPLALLLGVSFAIATPAFSQDPTIEQINATIRENDRKRELAEKQQWVQEFKGNDVLKRNRAFYDLTSGNNKLSTEEAIPLFTQLIRVDRPKTATRDEYSQFDEFNGQLISALGQYGEKSRPALQKIATLATIPGQNDGVRYSTLDALRYIAPRDPLVLATYFKLLKQKDDYFVDDVIRELDRLAALGVNVNKSVPLIAQRLESDDEYLQLAAFNGIGGIKKAKLPAAALTVERLTSNLKHLNKASLEKAAYTLTGLSEARFKAQKALPLLQTAYKNENRSVIKHDILNTIAAIGVGNDVTLLRFLLGEAGNATNYNLQFSRATYALHVKKQNTAAVEFLISALRPEQNKTLFSPTEQRFLARSEIKAAIVQALKWERNPSRLAAVPVAEVLREEAALPKPDTTLIQNCLDLLYDSGADGSQSASLILELLEPSNPLIKDGYEGDRRHVALLEIVGRFNISDQNLQKLATSRAIDGLKDKNKSIYAASARLAGSLGSSASDALPLLLPALNPDFQDQTLTTRFGWTYMSVNGTWAQFAQHQIFGVIARSIETRGTNSISSLSAYSADDAPLGFIISARMEAIRAIRSIGLPVNSPAIPLIGAITEETAPQSFRLEILRLKLQGFVST